MTPALAARSRIPWLVLAAIVSVAGYSRGDLLRPKWVAWLDRVVPRLPKATPPPPVPAEWVTVHTPDTLPLRLGPEYRPRNRYGCWGKNADRWPGPGWRDVCVRRESDPSDPGGFEL